jgi:hypothetical protein
VADAEPVVQPTELQNAAAFAGPAPGVTRFVANLGPTGVRLAFLEDAPDGTPCFRGAVTMHPQDGIKLYKMLQGMLSQLEQAFEKMDQEAGG